MFKEKFETVVQHISDNRDTYVIGGLFALSATLFGMAIVALGKDSRYPYGSSYPAYEMSEQELADEQAMWNAIIGKTPGEVAAILNAHNPGTEADELEVLEAMMVAEELAE